MKSIWIKQQGEDCTLSIFVQAGAKTSGVVGLHGEWLKIRIAAPRVEDLANESLLNYLAELLNVGKKEISILKGELGTYKIVRISKQRVDDLVLRVEKEIAHTSKGSKK